MKCRLLAQTKADYSSILWTSSQTETRSIVYIIRKLIATLSGDSQQTSFIYTSISTWKVVFQIKSIKTSSDFRFQWVMCSWWFWRCGFFISVRFLVAVLFLLFVVLMDVIAANDYVDFSTFDSSWWEPSTKQSSKNWAHTVADYAQYAGNVGRLSWRVHYGEILFSVVHFTMVRHWLIIFRFSQLSLKPIDKNLTKR